MISSRPSYRFDNCPCAGRAEDSDEQHVALRCRKTTTKRSQRRERHQLPHPGVHLQDTFHFALILEAPDPSGKATEGPGLATTRQGGCRHIDGDAIGQRDHRADPRDRHQAPAHIIVADNGQQAAMQDKDQQGV
jgi:hypothetical protein